MPFTDEQIRTKKCGCGGKISQKAQGWNDYDKLTFTWESWFECDKCKSIHSFSSGREYGQLKPRPTADKGEKI